MMVPLIPWRWAAVLAMTLGFAARSVAAREQSLPAVNCAVTLPADWEDLTPTREKPDNLVAAFGTHDQSHSLLIRVLARGTSSYPADGWFVQEVDAFCKLSGIGPKIEGKFTEAANVRCYERRSELLTHGRYPSVLVRAFLTGEGNHDRYFSVLVRAFPTGEGTYLLQGNLLDGDFDSDSDVRQAIASFRFLRPPPPVSKSRSAGQRLRLTFGRYGVPALLFCLLLAVILGIVGVCLRLARHLRLSDYSPDRALDGGPPPPLPPTPDDRPSGPYQY